MMDQNCNSLRVQIRSFQVQLSHKSYPNQPISLVQCKRQLKRVIIMLSGNQQTSQDLLQIIINSNSSLKLVQVMIHQVVCLPLEVTDFQLITRETSRNQDQQIIIQGAINNNNNNSIVINRDTANNRIPIRVLLMEILVQTIILILVLVLVQTIQVVIWEVNQLVQAELCQVMDLIRKIIRVKWKSMSQMRMISEKKQRLSCL